MDTFYLIIMILGGMTLSLIAIYAWIGMWDAIGAGLKKLFHIGKKEKINWHTLDEKQETVDKSDVIKTTNQVSENERFH